MSLQEWNGITLFPILPLGTTESLTPQAQGAVVPSAIALLPDSSCSGHQPGSQLTLPSMSSSPLSSARPSGATYGTAQHCCPVQVRQPSSCGCSYLKIFTQSLVVSLVEMSIFSGGPRDTLPGYFTLLLTPCHATVFQNFPLSFHRPHQIPLESLNQFRIRALQRQSMDWPYTSPRTTCISRVARVWAHCCYRVANENPFPIN